MRSATGARSRPPAGEGADRLLRVGDEERAELDRLEAGRQLTVFPGARDLLQAKVGLVPEALVQLALAEDPAVVGVAVDRGVVRDGAAGPELVHRHHEAEAPPRP